MAGRAGYRLKNTHGSSILTAAEYGLQMRVVDAEALEVVGDGGYDLGARARQIRDALMAKRTFEPLDMLAIQYDDRALFLTPWRNLLLELLTEDVVAIDTRLAEYRRLVEGWTRGQRQSPLAIDWFERSGWNSRNAFSTR